jgi:uncharacterized protein YggL (DUF469 family)
MKKEDLEEGRKIAHNVAKEYYERQINTINKTVDWLAENVDENDELVYNGVKCKKTFHHIIWGKVNFLPLSSEDDAGKGKGCFVELNFNED